MGMKQKVEALEAQIATYKQQARLANDAMQYIENLAKLPEDAVLLYTLSGQQISHEIGKSARVFMERFK